MAERDGEVEDLMKREEVVKGEKEGVVRELEGLHLEYGKLKSKQSETEEQLRAKEEENEKQREEMRHVIQKNFYE